MAATNLSPNAAPPSTSTSIATLRAQAQAHLLEIEQDKAAERADRLIRDQQLELYSRRPRRHQQGRKSTSNSRSRQAASETEAETPSAPSASALAEKEKEKLPRQRTAHDVLHRLQHDPMFDSAFDRGSENEDEDSYEYIIGYLERFDGIVEMPAAAWIRESTHEDFVPQHRIRYIARKKRRSRKGERRSEADTNRSRGNGDGDEEEEKEVVWSREGRVDRIFGRKDG